MAGLPVFAWGLTAETGTQPATAGATLVLTSHTLQRACNACKSHTTELSVPSTNIASPGCFVRLTRTTSHRTSHQQQQEQPRPAGACRRSGGSCSPAPSSTPCGGTCAELRWVLPACWCDQQVVAVAAPLPACATHIHPEAWGCLAIAAPSSNPHALHWRELQRPCTCPSSLPDLSPPAHPFTHFILPFRWRLSFRRLPSAVCCSALP